MEFTNAWVVFGLSAHLVAEAPSARQRKYQVAAAGAPASAAAGTVAIGATEAMKGTGTVRGPNYRQALRTAGFMVV